MTKRELKEIIKQVIMETKVITKRFKWENKNGGKFQNTYSFGLRNSDFENIRRIWSLALDDCGWENRHSLCEIDKTGNNIMTWEEYLKVYEK